MFYSGISISLPKVINLNKCIYIDKKGDKRIIFSFEHEDVFIEYFNDVERDNEFENIINYIYEVNHKNKEKWMKSNEFIIKNMYIEIEKEFINLKDIQNIIVSEKDNITYVTIFLNDNSKHVKLFDSFIEAEEYIQKLKNMKYTIIE